jgi:class 3 adenylate cyclase/TolB-like protein
VGETRKLAAILAADVVGYSRLMGEDEAGTAKIVRDRREAATPIVRAFGGRVVNATGDGVLLEFPSVVAAVECAIAIQKLMAERNASLPEAKRILYRIGINLGDILIDGEDILGDGVNIAARLEGICESGGICISGSAYEHIQGRIAAEFVDLGDQSLKNISRPVRVYALSPDAIAAVTEASPNPTVATYAATGRSAQRVRTLSPRLGALAAALVIVLLAAGAFAWHSWIALGLLGTSVGDKLAAGPHLSIVVLPFANLSGDPAQDYFADRITDDLTTALSRTAANEAPLSAGVIAHRTALIYKGRNIDAKDIGRELGVRYVLDGSVQRDQNRVKVDAQLVDAESDASLWADQFENDTADVSKQQDEVVARVARSVDFALTRAEAAKGRSKNPDAVDLTMRAFDVIVRGIDSKSKNLEARALFERALQINPGYAQALAGSAETYYNDYVHGWGDPRTDYEAKVVGQADQAIRIAPNDPYVYYPKAIYLPHAFA